MSKLVFHFLLSMPGEIISAVAPHSSRRDILSRVGEYTFSLMRFPEQKGSVNIVIFQSKESIPQ